MSYPNRVVAMQNNKDFLSIISALSLKDKTKMNIKFMNHSSFILINSGA